MRSGRKEEIIACGKALERLADKLVEEWDLDHPLVISIEFYPQEPVDIRINKKIIPKEYVKIFNPNAGERKNDDGK